MGIGKRIKRNGKLTYEHKEVMEAYLGRELSSGEVIHHLDDNPFNNHIDNLELLTRGQHTGCHNKGQGKLTEADIVQIRTLYKKGYGCRRIAKAFNVGRSTVRDIKDRKTWAWV